jgi:uncharacterized protein YqeY
MATLEEQVMAQMKDAMKSKDEALLRGLRAIKAEIIKAKTDPGAGGSITAEAELKLLQKLVKSRKDSLTIYQEQNRADLAQKETEEITVIEKFLPAQLSEAEVEAVVVKIIAENGFTGMASMGQLMGLATKALAGKTDGKTISTLVKKLLNS